MDNDWHINISVDFPGLALRIAPGCIIWIGDWDWMGASLSPHGNKCQVRFTAVRVPHEFWFV